jgi:hypothetical protein
MRRLFILLCIVTPFSVASAETPSSKEPADNRHSEQSTGKTAMPDKGQDQPQGPTGPITTGSSGGAHLGGFPLRVLLGGVCRTF